MGLEARGLRRRLGPPAGRPGAGGARPLIVRTVGLRAVALARLASDPALDGAAGVLVTGLCGGCAPGVGPGDLLVADEVVTPDGEGPGLRPDPWLRALAERAAVGAGLTHRAGRLLTVPHVAPTVASKAACWQTHGALGVEMEGWPVLAWARARGLPALAVRAVVDGAADPMPPALAAALTPGGRIRPGALAAWARHPRLVGEAWRTWRRSRLALDHLGRFLAALAAVPAGP